MMDTRTVRAPRSQRSGKEDAKDAILYSVVGTERRNARSSTNITFCQRFRFTARSSGERLKVSASSSDMLMSTVIAATVMHASIRVIHWLSDIRISLSCLIACAEYHHCDMHLLD